MRNFKVIKEDEERAACHEGQGGDVAGKDTAKFEII